jgi:hypothetical protein
VRKIDTSKRDVEELLAAGVIDDPVAERILAYIAERGSRRDDAGGSGGPALPSFDLVHAAYYLGGAVILFALAWFAAEAWDRYGGWPLAAVAASYAAFFAIVGQLLWQRGWKIPGGLLFTAAIAMTPLFVFAVQSGLGIWPGPGEAWPPETYESVNVDRVVIEVATLGVALAVIRLRPFAFHAVVLAAAAVILAWDLGPLLVGPLTAEEAQQTATVVAGGLLMGAAYLVDHRSREDYALWLYVGGLVSYWPLFTALHHDGIRYLVVNLLFIGLAVLIQRRVFLAAGAVGVFVYLMYLANEVFRDSLLYPAALSGIGLLFILAGVAYAKRQDRARAWLLDRMPASWVDSLPQNRGAASTT